MSTDYTNGGGNKTDPFGRAGLTEKAFQRAQSERGRKGGTVSGIVRAERIAQPVATAHQLRSQGLMQREIASYMGISQPTVSRYLRRSFEPPDSGPAPPGDDSPQ